MDRRLVPRGALEVVFQALLMRAAQVAGVQSLSDHFRLITLSVDEAVLPQWRPGDRLRLHVGDRSSRTYTPFTRDWTPGQLLLLVQSQSMGPGRHWLTRATVGDTWHVALRKGSLSLSRGRRATLLVGDETSLGLALSIRSFADWWRNTRIILEVNDLAQCRTVLQQLNLQEVELIERSGRDEHLADVQGALLQAYACEPRTEFVLTGKSTSLQQLQRALRRGNVPEAQVQIKPHWTPGRSGLR